MSTIVLSKSRFKQIVGQFPDLNIMVIGDVMLDEYMWGEVQRISPEAPVPVVEVEEVTLRFGGAANVVNNLSSLGVVPVLVSVCGDDTNGKTMRSLFTDINCSTNYLFGSSHRPTTIKTRVIARHQQVVRADREMVKDLTDTELSTLLSYFETACDSVHGIIVSDYGKGVICAPFIKAIVKKCKEKGIFVAVDPKERHFDLYNGVTVITPNLKEAHAILNMPYNRHPSDEYIQDLGWKLLDFLNCAYVLLTLSERGMGLFEAEGRKYTSLPTVAQKVYDVTGAGDTVISAFTAALSAGASPVEAAFISNHAAGLTVAELGCASVDVKALLKVCCVK